MKVVLISVKPRHCGNMASGEKTDEIRKTKPKLETPFKCYIYCTKDKKLKFWTGKRYSYADEQSHNLFDRCGNGKIIGDFVCDRIQEVRQCNSGWVREHACITQDEFFDYLGIPRGTHFGYDKKAYAWHISDLVIYDKPKELSEFFKACDKPKGTDCSVCVDHRENRCKAITKPPQSWCYVESEVAE